MSQEDKLETEYRKIMGSYAAGAVSVMPRDFPLSAMVNRVHVRDGHSICMSLKLRVPATPEQVTAALRAYVPSNGALAGLPSSPAQFIEVRGVGRVHLCVCMRARACVRVLWGIV